MNDVRPTNFKQAYLELEGQQSDPIVCWFNPKDYSISKQNTWDVKPVVGQALPTVQFTGGQARQLTLDLLFDASDTDSMDVVGITNRLFRMMQVDEKLGSGSAKNSARPPKVKFGWGSTLSFEAVPTSLAVQYTHFRPDGTPVRATAKLTLVQVDETVEMAGGSGTARRQNPTTTGIAGVRSHVVRDGDSLPSIAFAAYGDATRWRVVAEANGIDNPLALRRGEVLSIPVDAEERR